MPRDLIKNWDPYLGSSQFRGLTAAEVRNWYFDPNQGKRRYRQASLRAAGAGGRTGGGGFGRFLGDIRQPYLRPEFQPTRPLRAYQPDPSPRGPSGLGHLAGEPFGRLGPALGSKLQDMASAGHRVGADWVRWELGLATGEKLPQGGRMHSGLWGNIRTKGLRGIGLKALGPAFLAYGAYQGYQEGGVWGATKGTALHAAETYGMGFALGGIGKGLGITSLGGLVGGLATGVAAVGAGAAVAFGPVWAAHKAMEAGGRRIKAARRLELATPHLDLYGGAATMRQRSIAAMNRSALNGRYLLGNEAAVMHS